MARIINRIVLVLFFVNLVFCEYQKDVICIYTEGGKVCDSQNSVKSGSDEHRQSSAEVINGSPAVAAVEGTASVSDSRNSNANTTITGNTSNSIAAGNISKNNSNAVNNSSPLSETSNSNRTQTNSSKQVTNDSAVQENTNVEDSSPIVDKANTSKQESSVAERNSAIEENPGVSVEANTSKKEIPAIPVKGNTNIEESSAAVAEVNTANQENSAAAAQTNSNKEDSSSVVAGGNTIKEENSAASAETNTSVKDSPSGVPKGNTTLQVSPIVTGQWTMSNATSGIQLPEQSETKNQTSGGAAEGPAEHVAVADSILQNSNAQSDDLKISESEQATSNLSPAQQVALAEGVVIADTVLQVAGVRPSNNPSPAETASLAEGLEVAEEVVQEAREEEPEISAIWRATFEAESSWKEDGDAQNEGNLDIGLISFLVVVMIVLAITGSVSGWVLYTRLRRKPEEDLSPSMYILVDDSDAQATFVDCPLELNDLEGVSYTFPRVSETTA